MKKKQPIKRSKKPASKKIVKKPVKEEFPHFRKYNKSNHPALITGEHNEDEYQFRKVTHSVKEGSKNNEKVEPNPNPLDPRPMYIVKRKRHNKKKFFSKRKYPWKYRPPKK